jgi:hypothetical protein
MVGLHGENGRMRIRFIEEQGVRLLLLDFSRMTDNAATLALIEEAKKFFLAQPKRKEILTLTDVSKMRFDNAVLKAFEDLIRHDEPWEKAVAVCGLVGIGLVTFRAQNLVTGGRMNGFTKRDEAVAWLVKQAKPAKS